MSRRVNIVPGPDGDPIVTPIDESEETMDIDRTDETTDDDIPVTASRDTIIVKHTYCYVAGNQTQYTTVGVEMVAQPDDTMDSMFAKANAVAANGVQIAADTLTEVINDRRAQARKATDKS